jgi:hypothetical protein
VSPLDGASIVCPVSWGMLFSFWDQISISKMLEESSIEQFYTLLFNFRCSLATFLFLIALTYQIKGKDGASSKEREISTIFRESKNGFSVTLHLLVVHFLYFHFFVCLVILSGRFKEGHFSWARVNFWRLNVCLNECITCFASNVEQLMNFFM